MAALVPREAVAAGAAKRELFGFAFEPVRLYIDKLSRHKNFTYHYHSSIILKYYVDKKKLL